MKTQKDIKEENFKISKLINELLKKINVLKRWWFIGTSHRLFLYLFYRYKILQNIRPSHH